MTLYKLLRNTHLLIGLFSFLFVMMYAISSVQMAHNTWFDLRAAISESQSALAAGMDDPRAIARALMDRGQVKGELQQIRKTPQGFAFRIVRPGTVYEITYATQSGTANIRANVAGFMGMLNRLHHVGGLWHEYTLTNVWAVFVAIISMILIVLALTGIYLWFKIHAERTIGIVLLTLSLGYSLTLIILMRSA